MESILGLAKTEGMLFKYGSGTGSTSRRSAPRRSRWPAAAPPPGPVSFMRASTRSPGVIKSRRQDAPRGEDGHPQRRPPGRRWSSSAARRTRRRRPGRSSTPATTARFNGGGAYDSVFFQNANNSVRVTDEFMKAVLDDATWQTTRVVARRASPTTFTARDLMQHDRRGGLAVRRPGHAVRHHHQRLAHLLEHGAASTLATRARSTCSWTTPPATWRR